MVWQGKCGVIERLCLSMESRCRKKEVSGVHFGIRLPSGGNSRAPKLEDRCRTRPKQGGWQEWRGCCAEALVCVEPVEYYGLQAEMQLEIDKMVQRQRHRWGSSTVSPLSCHIDLHPPIWTGRTRATIKPLRQGQSRRGGGALRSGGHFAERKWWKDKELH